MADVAPPPTAAAVMGVDNQAPSSPTPQAEVPIASILPKAEDAPLLDELTPATDSDPNKAPLAPATGNQETHDNDDYDNDDNQQNECVVEATEAEEVVDDGIRASDMESRLTWIGEGLLDGEGLDAVEQLGSLPSVAGSAPPTPDGNKLLNFLAQEQTFSHAPTSARPPLAKAASGSSTAAPSSSATNAATPKKERRQNKLLDFLATDIGERYLNDVYQDEERDEALHPDLEEIDDDSAPPQQILDAPPSTSAAAATHRKPTTAPLPPPQPQTDLKPEPVAAVTAPKPSSPPPPQRASVPAPAPARDSLSKGPNNKLLAFLAKERGERVHSVEHLELKDAEIHTEPIGATSRYQPHAAPAVAAPEPASEVIEEISTETMASAKSIDTNGHPPHAHNGKRSKLQDFIGKAPPNKPKFVIYNPEELHTSSSSDEEDSPSGRGRELPTAALGGDDRHRRVRFDGPEEPAAGGHVVRQAVTDRYGRTELLDFVPPGQHAAPPARPIPRRDARSPSPSRFAAPPHEFMPTPVPTPIPTPAASSSSRSDGRIASFLRKLSGREEKTNGSKASSPPRAQEQQQQHQPHANRHDPPRQTRREEPLSMFRPRPAPRTLHGFDIKSPLGAAQPAPPLVGSEGVRISSSSSVSSNGNAAPVEPEAPETSGNLEVPAGTTLVPSDSALPLDSSSRRLEMLTKLRQLTEECDRHDLSDVAMVRISILLATLNQIVKEDLRKERPAQTIMRRLSINTPAAAAAPAPWVRSEKEKEEYERGHTTTIADIANRVGMRLEPTPEKAPAPAVDHHYQPLNVVVAESVMRSFTQFETAQNLHDTMTAFQHLLRDCGIGDQRPAGPLRVYRHIRTAIYDQLSFRQKQLFRLLDSKLALDVYRRQPCDHKRVCIVGAGPVGLRAAVELGLLGAQVVVIDKRKQFSRENILHMWPWVVQDLTSLGAKVLFPQFCHSTAYFHVGTRQLQCILLKVALLLGVTLYAGTSFEGLAAPDSIVSERKPFYTVVTKPQIPWMEYTAVLGACGTKDKLSTHAGIKRFVYSRKEAIGLVCYFPNLGTNEEKKVKEFSWTIQFKQSMFAKMREIGIDLENVVYYRGEYHYIVMTPKRQNLLEQGVLKINYPIVSDLVAVDNIDPTSLNDYVSRIINFFEIPQKSEFARVRLFDFSTRTRAAQAANILTSRGKKLYVGLIGDALMEPFWPEGLGTCRGFLSALDGCWMVSQIGKQSDAQLLADRELGYRIVQHISGFQRDDLHKNPRKYNVDPSSRYTVQFPAALE